MTIDILGIDIAKNVFQLHGVNRNGGVVFKRRVMRDQLLGVIAQIDHCTIVIEACTPRSSALGSGEPQPPATCQ
jgi:transposase